MSTEISIKILPTNWCFDKINSTFCKAFLRTLFYIEIWIIIIANAIRDFL